MLLYVLPFIILLVVAIILKKREANKEAEPSKKVTAVKAKPASTSSAEVVENVATPKQNTLVANARSELAPELRRHIESQMRDGNYFAAEAQINQALNRDNGQHELYLMLLDLHLLQNDEFAINQLFTHLRSLQLNELLLKAQQKREAHEQKIAAEAKAKADAQAAQLAARSISFDQLQEEVTQAKPQAPLEFNKTAEKAAVEPQPATQEVKPLEFSFSSAKPKSTDVEPAQANTISSVEPEVKAEPKPLDFAFNLATQDPTPAAPQSQPEVANQSLDFSFTPTAQNTVKSEVQPKPTLDTTAKTLDFNFSTTTEKPKSNPELEFNLDQADTSTNKKQSLEFSLDTPATPPTKPAAPEVNAEDFEFKIEQPKAEPSIAAAPQAPVQAAPERDPLLQLFPALGQINEADLNLRLAAQYIRLGAYQDAQALLAEDEGTYNEQQRQAATVLRNKIA